MATATRRLSVARSRARRASLRTRAVGLLVLAPLGACDGFDGRPATPAAAPAAAGAGAAVDSVLPPGEAHRRFTAAFGEPPTALSGGAPSIDSLASRFARAIAAGDSVALTSLFLDAREFAFLYYPTHPFSREPYRLPPDLLWSMHSDARASGMLRLRASIPAAALRASARCRPPRSEGENHVHADCALVIRAADSGAPVLLPWGVVVSRGGRYKLATLDG